VGQLIELDHVARTPLEPVPRRAELSVLGSLARHLPGVLRIVPDTRLGQPAI
jgi:hypothetical protein